MNCCPICQSVLKEERMTSLWWMESCLNMTGGWKHYYQNRESAFGPVLYFVIHTKKFFAYFYTPLGWGDLKNEVHIYFRDFVDIQSPFVKLKYFENYNLEELEEKFNMWATFS